LKAVTCVKAAEDFLRDDDSQVVYIVYTVCVCMCGVCYSLSIYYLYTIYCLLYVLYTAYSIQYTAYSIQHTFSSYTLYRPLLFIFDTLYDSQGMLSLGYD
jgi:hypothetical protein